jgi:hypothetical protein
MQQIPQILGENPKKKPPVSPNNRGTVVEEAARRYRLWRYGTDHKERLVKPVEKDGKNGGVHVVQGILSVDDDDVYHE